jgi:glyceraldehyde 3-phosphate dehydrogenase
MQGFRLAINGMGRIGRTLFRLLYEKKSIQNVIVVNDIMPKDNLIYLLKYDSIRGALATEISPTTNGFSIDGHEIFYYQQAEIKNLPWQKHSIKTVIEATGLFTHSADASLHLSNGAKHVLLTTFSKDIPSTILGVNYQNVNREAKIISPGDCTINCVAPLINLIQKNFGINSVHVNVIQAYTTRQQLLDGPYKGLRRGRAANHSIIPFEVNITPVLETIFPTLKNRIESISTRVPVPCGALADISFVLQNPTDAKAVNSIITNASQEELNNLTDITFDPIVSADILGNAHSSTIDGSLTRVMNGNHLKIFAWFDNEWGYANRLLDWLNPSPPSPLPGERGGRRTG